MAFTAKNGMRIGMARHYELRDQRDYVQEISDPNSLHWKIRLNKAFEVICADEQLADIWESELVPDHTSFQEHALLAESIVRGELDEPFRILQNITVEAQGLYFDQIFGERG